MQGMIWDDQCSLHGGVEFVLSVASNSCWLLSLQLTQQPVFDAG